MAFAGRGEREAVAARGPEQGRFAGSVDQRLGDSLEEPHDTAGTRRRLTESDERRAERVLTGPIADDDARVAERRQDGQQRAGADPEGAAEGAERAGLAEPGQAFDGAQGAGHRRGMLARRGRQSFQHVERYVSMVNGG